MKTFRETPTTYVCQFAKASTYAQLVAYSTEKDLSGAKLAEFYEFAVSTVKNTPAFNQPGTIAMLNDLVAACRKTKYRTNCGAQARKLKRTVDWYADSYAKAQAHYGYQVLNLLTDAELEELKNC